MIKSKYLSRLRKCRRGHCSCKERKEQMDHRLADHDGIRVHTTHKIDRHSREDIGSAPPNQLVHRLHRDELSPILRRLKILDPDEYTFRGSLWRSSLTKST